MADIKFTLGECNASGRNYRFNYDNGSYHIIELLEDKEKPLETIKDSREAYKRWNEIKRPEKSKH